MGQELLKPNEAHQKCGTGPEVGLVGVTLGSPGTCGETTRWPEDSAENKRVC